MLEFLNGIKEQFYQSVIEQDRYLLLLQGLGKTLVIAFFAVLLGVVVGIMISILRNRYEETGKGRVLAQISRFYVTIIRGTPALLQLMILYYIIFQSVDINVVFVGVLAFGFNSAAYVSEIIRAGIDSVDKGQKEASRALGLSYLNTVRYIVLPQAIKNILPALGNEFITLLKETSVAGYIGIVELVKASDIIASGTYDYFFPLLLVAFLYLLLTLGLSKLLKLFEKKVLRHASY